MRNERVQIQVQVRVEARVEAARERHRPRCRARVQYIVEDRTDQQDAKCFEQPNQRHQHDGCRGLQRVVPQVAEQAQDALHFTACLSAARSND